MQPAWFSSHQPEPFTQERLFIESKLAHTQYEYIGKLIEIKKYTDQPVLEIGSGHGTFALQLRKMGFSQYLGIDSDVNKVNFTRKAIGPYFRHQSLRETAEKHPDGFKVIFAFEKLQKVTNPYDYIQQIQSMLSNGGLFVGTTPYPFTRNIISDPEHLHVLHPKNWKRLLHILNFRRVQTYPMSFLPYLWKINPSLNPILPMYVPCLNMTSNTLIIAEKGN